MASIIKSDNGVSSGVTGIVQTADSTGQLAFQTTNSAGTAVTALTLNNSQQATFANTINVPNTFGFKNRIINGAMVIDQRNAGASVATPAGYTLDRWQVLQSTTGKISTQQNQGSVTPPSGFSNYLGVTSGSAYSVGSGDYYLILQNIEGYNVADLGYGTANAKTVTISFQVYSSLTGTFGGALTNGAGTRSYPFTYTVVSANTWTTISVTIAGDTTGTWGSTNSVGMQLIFGLGVGSTHSGTPGSWSNSAYYSATGAVSVVGTNGATFYITGVQLEVGTQATSFDYRPFTTELALCQRYCFVPNLTYNNYSGVCNSTTSGLVSLSLPVPMRIAPAGTFSGSFSGDNGLVVQTYSAANVSLNNSGVNTVRVYFTGGSGTAFTGGQAFGSNAASTGTIILSSEL